MLKRLLCTWPYLLVSVVMTAGIGLFETALIIRMLGLLDLALTKEMGNYIEQGGGIIIGALLLVPFAMGGTLCENLFKRKANEAMKSYYIEKIFEKDINEFNNENNSKYISCLNNDFNTLEMKLIDALYMLINGCVYFCSALWMMWTVNPIFIAIGMGVMVMNLGINTLAAKPIQKQTSLRSDLFDAYTASLKEVLSAFHIIKNNGLYRHVEKQFAAKSEKVQHKGYFIDKMITYIACVQNTWASLSIMGVMLLAGYMTLKGNGTVGGILLLYDAMHRVIGPSYMISEAMPQLFAVKNLVGKIEETLENGEMQEETTTLKKIEEKIVFDKVTFKYEEDTILEDAQLTLKKGGKYLLIGPSGGGKSTCLKLLRKYFNPQQGTIWIDNQPLHSIQKESYFSRIANVEQRVFIFEDTLRNNLTLYKPYTEEAIMEAIDKAGLTDFVRKDQEGLDKMLYENGKNISGGERSRIAIARGLLEKTDMILLDEAFSALDSEKAKEIEESLLSLEGVTVVQVSHVIFQENKAKYDGIFMVKDKKITPLSA